MLKNSVKRRADFISTSASEISDLTAEFFRDEYVTNLENVSGGLTNTVYKATTNRGNQYCLKINQRGEMFASLESAVSQKLSAPWVPECLFSGPGPQGHPLSVFPWARGTRLDLLYQTLSKTELQSIIKRVVEMLKEIHSVTFPTTGLLSSSGNRLKISEEIRLDQDALGSFARQVFSRPSVQELISEEFRSKFILWCSRLSFPSLRPCLNHGDFGPENVLYCQGSDALSIIDWEFTFAGTPLADLGHWLRSPLLPEPDFIAVVDECYDSLPADWPTIAMHLDLFAWLDFLNRDNVPGEITREAVLKLERALGAELFD